MQNNSPPEQYQFKNGNISQLPSSMYVHPFADLGKNPNRTGILNEGDPVNYNKEN